MFDERDCANRVDMKRVHSGSGRFFIQGPIVISPVTI